MNKKIIVFVGPSGVGKASIEKLLFAMPELKLQLSCSATTRTPREGEIEGVHYHFVSKSEFDQCIKDDKFIEWNEHFSNKYGTLYSEIDRIQGQNKIPLLEIETFGARNIINRIGKENVISIFIDPPSIQELKNRIKARGTETDKEIEERMAKVDEELSQKRHFDHIVVNNTVEDAANEIKNIILENV